MLWIIVITSLLFMIDFDFGIFEVRHTIIINNTKDTPNVVFWNEKKKYDRKCFKIFIFHV